LKTGGWGCHDAIKGMAGNAGIAGKGKRLGSEGTGFAAHCPHCRRESIFEPARVSHPRHLLLILLTGGLWTVVWVSLIAGQCMRPWRCASCGWHKPEFRKKAEDAPG